VRLDEAAIVEAASARLAPYKVPERIFVVDEIVTDGLGKVQRRAMRELALVQVGVSDQ
jgi:acyl-CoA synthetase (AMP-forming)/AMP-acid ligase II